MENRRDFLWKGLSLLGIAMVDCSSALHLERNVLPVQCDHQWPYIHLYSYLGKLTVAQALERVLLEKYPQWSEEQRRKYIEHAHPEEGRLHFLVGERIEILGFPEEAEPTFSEMVGYNRFCHSFGEKSSDELLPEIYEMFQERIGLEYNYAKAGAHNMSLIPPPLLLSRRMIGTCLDKAVALHEIYQKNHIDNKIAIGEDINRRKHAWVRLYQGKDFMDVDPTDYNHFTPLQRG